jgi:TRAP-type C4-dicarboxylate transport system permease small subunit
MAPDGAAAHPRLSRFATAFALVALAILLANAALIGMDVVARWLLRAPQSWVSDVGQVSYPVAIACCFPAALESGHMIAIRFLGEALGTRRAHVLDIIGQAALAALLALLAWKIFGRAAGGWAGGFRTSNIGLRVAPTWFAGAAVMLVSTLVQLGVPWRVCAGPSAVSPGAGPSSDHG